MTSRNHNANNGGYVGCLSVGRINRHTDSVHAIRQKRPRSAERDPEKLPQRGIYDYVEIETIRCDED
jgi:hypothetical protein